MTSQRVAADGTDALWRFDPTVEAWVELDGAASGERLVQDGTSPPVDLTLEDETDYLYEDI